MPTVDDGSTAFKYIKSFVQKNIPIVTCEKGALSNYFTSLERYLGKIGYSATVGGGSRMLPYAQERMNPAVTEVHAVVNGTLNYIFDGVSNGRSLDEVVEEAKRLGYAEPGATDILAIINGEAVGDVPKKTAILSYSLGLTKQPFLGKKFQEACGALCEADLMKVVQQSKIRRYIVSIAKEKGRDEDIIGGFKFNLDSGWYVSVGFKNIEENPIYSALISPGVNNALMTCEGKNGVYGTPVVGGQGAGAGPTANSMMIDARNLLRL